MNVCVCVSLHVYVYVHVYVRACVCASVCICIYSVIAHDSVSKFIFVVYFVFLFFFKWGQLLLQCVQDVPLKLYFWVFYITISNINILQSTPNYHDVLCFNVILVKRLDQSSFRRIWSRWLILLTAILLHLYCLLHCILCSE